VYPGVKKFPGLFGQNNINADHHSTGRGADHVKEGREEQHRASATHAGLKHKRRAEAIDQLLIKLQIEGALLDWVTQESVLLPGVW
jgi:hypothetical protein